MKTTQTNKRFIKAGVPLALIIIALGTYTAVAYTQSLWPFQTSESNVTQQNDSDDKNASDPTLGGEKTNPSDNTPPADTPEETDPTDKQQVSIGVAYAQLVDNQVEVRAYVSGVIEGTGTCTATLTKDGETVTASAAAFVDATTSQCGVIEIDRSKFPSAGTWNLVVSYSSPDAEGTSRPEGVTL